MQENWLELAQAFQMDQPMVVATIVATEGATYQKTGTMMLVNEQGNCTGLLSGGCLEADIALHSKTVLRSGKTKRLFYDLSSDADLLWGLGLGCEGKIEILLQPLANKALLTEFVSLLSHIKAGQARHIYQVIDDQKQPIFFHTPTALNDTELDVAVNQAVAYKSEVPLPVIHIPAYAPISLLICGAGPDAVPVTEFAVQMGWQVTLWDHRQSALSQKDFPSSIERRQLKTELITAKELNGFDGVVIMSHSLERDQMYLSLSIENQLRYIGLLGPEQRKDKLLKNLNVTSEIKRKCLFGPIGLNLGGRSPQAIALSIVSQIQQQLMLKTSAQRIKPSVTMVMLSD